MTDNRRLWILTFEYGPAKLGGLGEVPTNQVKHLQDDLDITVLMPAHGLVTSHGNVSGSVDYQLEKIPITLEFKQAFDTFENESLASVLRDEKDDVLVKVQLYKLIQEGVKSSVLLFSGADNISRMILDDPIIYNNSGLKSKIALFSKSLLHYTKYLYENDKNSIPDVIHVHDYHPVPGMLATKQYLMENDMDVAVIYTVHLLTWPRFQMPFLEACGVKDKSISVFLRKSRKSFTISRLLKMGGEHVEYLAAVVADIVTSVSRNYLEKQVVPNCGGGLLTGKIDYIYNGCDWNYEEIKSRVLRENKADINRYFNNAKIESLSSELLKEYLMLYKIGHIPENEHII
ncbi:MAG: glycogen/starch synthase, partial [Promethearchaeota archaeon]